MGTGEEQRRQGAGGLCRRLCVVLFAFSIITLLPMQCTALVLMMTPPPTPPLSHTLDNLAAAAEDNTSILTTGMTNKTTTTAAAVTNNNTTNNLLPNPPHSAAMSTNSPPLAASPAPQRKSRIELNKCCLFGEYLDKTKTCLPGATDKWIPRIFLIRNNSYYQPQGSRPKFIAFQDNVFPISQARSINAVAQNAAEVQDKDDISCTVDDLVLFTGGNSFVILSNGSLLLSESLVLMPPSRYCVDQQAALVCFQKSKHPEPLLKLKKCCGPHGIYDNQLNTCQVDGTRNNQLNLSLAENNTYQTIYGFPECRNESTAYAIAGDWSESQLLPNTSGLLHLPKHQVSLNSSDYCLETLRNDNNSSVKVFACLHHFGKENDDKTQTAALRFGLVVSVIFLAATLVASYLMPSIHHVLHWKCQIYYVFCLFIGKFLLVFSLMYKPLTLQMALCQIVSSTMHFFFLSAFFWLNTMCFNIWWTFRDFRPSSLERNQELIRLRLYSAYAWGIPLLIAAIAACVNLVPESSLLRPGFGEGTCWFNNEHLPIFAYFFGPVGILLSINIILFISTTYQLTCGLWKRDDVKSTTEKTALFKVCLKLVVVMGVIWIVDVLSWLIGGPNSAWFVTDLANALQGIFIFLVVGCQPQVGAACKRFCYPRSRQEITNTTNGVQHSSSSQGLPSLTACGGEITQNTSLHNTTTFSSSGVGGGGGLGNHIPTTTSTAMKIPMETVC